MAFYKAVTRRPMSTTDSYGKLLVKIIWRRQFFHDSSTTVTNSYPCWLRAEILILQWLMAKYCTSQSIILVTILGTPWTYQELKGLSASSLALNVITLSIVYTLRKSTFHLSALLMMFWYPGNLSKTHTQQSILRYTIKTSL